MKLNPKIPPWLAFLAVPAALLLMGCCSVERAMFPAPKPSYAPSPELLWLDANGLKVAALYIRAKGAESEGCVLFSHGNAEDLGLLRPYLELYAEHGYDVFAYDYPGYGLSEGSPSQDACFKSVIAAYSYLVGPLGVKPERVIALGRSIGSGPSVYLASKRKIGALVVESGFTSTYAVVLGVDSIPGDKFQNLERIKGLSCPVLAVHGRKDEVIAFKHGEALYAAAKEPKAKLWVEAAGHNDLVETAGESYWTALAAFASSSLPKL